jgi:putative N6-adenine-specific DNA methylase
MAAAGGKNITAVAGGVGCQGTLETAYRINLESRIATRLLWRQAQGGYRNEADIYRLAHEVDWSRMFSVDRSIRVYVTAIRSPLKSIEFITLKAKDAVCDRFRADTGRRPSVNTKNPEVRIHLFLTDQQARIYLDTSGEPLYLRGHKLAKVGAPLKENLAAGILRLSGWQPGTPLLDPMCGSGTFLLEAAQISARRRAGPVARCRGLRLRAAQVFRCRAVAQAANRSGGTAARGKHPAYLRQRPRQRCRGEGAAEPGRRGTRRSDHAGTHRPADPLCTR